VKCALIEHSITLKPRMIKLLAFSLIVVSIMAAGSAAIIEENGNCKNFEITYTFEFGYSFIWTAFCDKEMATSGAVCSYKAWYFAIDNSNALIKA